MNDTFTIKTFGEDTYGRHALADSGDPGDVLALLEVSKALTVHPTRLRDSYAPKHAAISDAEKPRADGAPRMTITQRDALWELCGRYNVLFREGDYLPAFDLPDGWYSGWVGGLGSRCSLFVGVSPDGEVNS